MFERINVKAILIVILAAVMLVAMVACVPASEDANYPFGIQDDGKNYLNKDHTTKDEAIKRTSDSITNLKNYLKSATVADTGYYMEFDFDVDTDTGDNFELKFRGNLYTYPYEIKDENGNVIGEDPDAKAVHNEVIKKSDLLIEWYNGHTNELMIGFYFDGLNASKENPGNHLYLNLRGYKRWYRNFGNTVLFQQIMRLITNLDIELMLADNDSSIDQSINQFAAYLSAAVNDNYQKTQNGSTTTIFYENVILDTIADDISKAIGAVFGPFEDKIDPLTNKYLGFKFSTLGQVQIRTLNTDLAFHIEPDITETLDVLYGVDANMNGTSLSYGVSVPFRSNAYVRYSTRVSNDIRFDLQGYVEFIHGQYDFTALLDIPTFNLRYDGEIITSLTEKDNMLNKIDARFRNLATQEYAVMLFYREEKFYLNTEGIEDIYGAIQIDELGFPKVFYEGIDLAELFRTFYDTVNNGIVSIVDALLNPETYHGEGVDEGLIRAITAKMRSEGDTMTLTVDIELIKEVLRYTQKVDPNEESPYYTLDDKGRPLYTTKGLVMLFSDWLGYDMEQIAAIFGVASAEILLERSWFEITYDVETNRIVIEMFTSIRQDRAVVFRLTLIPEKVGEKVTFPTEMENWDSYKPLEEVKTLSATLNGDIRFASDAEVDLSRMLASFIDDRSGLNTAYRTAPNARILFTLVFDQYIQYTDPEGNDNLQFILGELEDKGVEIDMEEMVGQMRGRMAFYFSMTVQSNRGEELVARLYAYNVAFNQDVYDRIEAGQNVPEGYGYVYVDLTGGLNPGRADVPLMKIREDYFMHSFFDYTGKTDAANSAATLSIYSILMAILEDSTFYTTDAAVSITTSNRLLQRIFGIDDLVANFTAQVGFRQRVKDRYSVISMVDRFADYEVSVLSDLEVLGVYDNTVPIHKTIAVEFRWPSGDSLTKILKFRYYKEYEPNREEFYNDEEYQAALDKYNAYVASRHNIDIVPDKDRYYPSVDGTFMGAERNYVLTVNGGANQRNATAKIESLYETEFRWEPFEDKPSTIRAVNSNNGLVTSYPADFSIDWSKITVDGLDRAYYTVTVGPDSLGEFTAEVAISVINRRVVNGDGTAADVVYVYNGGEEVSASVAASLTIDPYDYIVSRYASPQRFEDGIYITDYLKSRASQVTLNFAGGDSERGYFDWFFDDADGVGNNRETAINERGGKLYLHTSFHNQIIALELTVLQRIVDRIEVIGEEEPNTYTVDVLDRSTYTLPVRPTVYFKDENGSESSRVFAFDFIWSYAAVDNVNMDGAPVIDGQPSPFAGQVGNTVSAYLDIERAFGIGEWFGKQIVTLKVETPPKVISDLYEVDNAKNAAGADGETVKAVSIAVSGTRERGYWIIDDRFESSYGLPSTVTAYFDDGTDKNYTVEWDTSTGLVTRQNGAYTVSRNIINNTDVEFYYVRASLDGVYEFCLVLVKLPFRGADIDIAAWNRTDGQEDVKLNINKGVGAGRYIYEVNPYDDVFLIPNVIEEVFDDGGIPIGRAIGSGELHYFRNKYAVTPAVNGLEYVYVLGEGSSSVTATIEVSTDGTVAKSIEFLNAGVSAGSGEQTVFADAAVTMEVSAVSDSVKRILIGGIIVPGDGVIYAGGRNYTARGLVETLLSNVRITMEDNSSKVRNPEIVNFNGVFDSAELQLGIHLTLRMSIVPGILDYEVIVKGQVDEQHPAVVNDRITLQPFDSDPENGNRYQNGYSLTTHRVEFEDGTTETFTDWYVGAFNGVKGLKVGQLIRTITPEMLLDKYPFGSTVNITVYTFRADDTKISTTFTVPTLDWSRFQSVNYSGEFAISDGVIVIRDMYSTDILSIRGVLDRLPTSIRFYNIEVNNVRWRAADGAEEKLANLRYDDNNQFALATATVNAGGLFDVTLYIRFENCEVSGIENFGNTVSDGRGNVTVRIEIDPYADGSTGIYRLPSDFVLRYSSGRTHPVYGAEYRLGDDAQAERFIPYIYNGFSDSLQDGERDYVVDIGRGQTVTFKVSVIDRTFKSYAVNIGTDTANITDFGISADGAVIRTVSVADGLAICLPFEIDPYRVVEGEGYLPGAIVADAFVNSATVGAFTLPVVWTTEFVVDYEGSAITVVEGYIVGTGNQPLSFAVEVKQRPASAYDAMLSDEYGNPVPDYTDGNNAGAGIYNFGTRQPDPFAYGADNLPKYAHLVAKNNSELPITVPIEWKIEPNTFNVAGGTAVVHGYLAAEGVGHHVTLTVASDVWTFVRIARPVDTGGTGDYTAWEYRDMSPIRFTFVSLISENGYFEMTDRAFRATFRVTDGNGNDRFEYKYFVPEAYAADGDLKIYFNGDAVRQAAQSSSKEIASNFYLGDGDKVRMQVNGNITYLVEAPIIETDSVVYYYSTSGGAQYLPYILIDPLNPSLPTKAYSYTNWSPDRLVEWTLTSTAEFGEVNLSSYLVGGILRGKNFAFTLKDADGANIPDQSGNAITQAVPVQLLFIDRTVAAGEATTKVTSGNEERVTVSLAFKDTFDAYTYSGKANPYGSYGEVIDALNAAVSIYGSTRTVEVVYEITESGERIFKEFRAGGNVYTKDIFGDAPIMWQ